VPSAIIAPTFNRSILRRLSLFRVQHFRVALDMLVALVLRKIEPVQVLGDLPQLGRDRAIYL
jgi:hypothetical protein